MIKFNKNSKATKSANFAQQNKFALSTLPNDNFSPESGGNVNPNNAIEAISTHGRLN